jgi:MFS family permease
MVRNFRRLYLDIVGYGILAGSILAFLSVYAAHLGATSFQIAMLTAGPAVINLLASLPAGRWLEREPIAQATYLTAVWNRVPYVLLVLGPLFLGLPVQIVLITAVVLVISLPGTALAIGFNAMFAEVVPPEWRGQVVGWRNVLLAISVTLTSVICGPLLDRIRFPLNYQIIFAVGTAGALLSTWALGRIWSSPVRPRPARRAPSLGESARPGSLRFLDALRQASGLHWLTRTPGEPFLRLDLLRGRLGLFLFSYLFFYTCQYVPIPLFPLFWVDRLHLSDGTISVGNALFYTSMLVASMGLASASRRFGHRRILVGGALVYALYPLLNGLARDAFLFWVASLVGGAVWALVNAGLVNRLMEQVPEEDRPAGMALHNLVLNLGILVGSLSGPLLAAWTGLGNALLLSAGLRLLAGGVLTAWG